MIRVERGLAPAFFSSLEHAALKQEIAAYFEDYDSAKRQVRYSFEQVRKMYKYAQPVLIDRFSAKCAYCESTIGESARFVVDHFRPRTGARDYSQQFENHYWWLALEWTNLVLACPECNNSKAAWFPLASKSIRAAPPGHSGPGIADEKPLLLDPCVDEPALHLRYESHTGYMQALSERGAATIEILALNRSTLVESRRKQFAYLDQLLQDFMHGNFQPATLTKYFNAGQAAYSLAVQRQFLRDKATKFPDFQQLLMDLTGAALAVAPVVVKTVQNLLTDLKDVAFAAVPEIAKVLRPMPKPKLSRLAIERIELHNFRNIVDLTLDVPLLANEQGSAPWILFLGENAVGKSSIMQAVVLTLMGDEGRSKINGLRPEDFLHYSWVNGRLEQAEAGWVKIKVSGLKEPLQLSFQRGHNDFESSGPPARSYLIAYGSTRLLPDEESVAYESTMHERVRVQHLFKASTPLVDAEEWLYQQYEKDPQAFDMIVRGLRDMLLMRDGDTIGPDKAYPDKRRILIDFKSRKEVSTVSHLSDGYRTVLALTCDMMSVLVHEGTSMETVEGIVIIDELESNLHPRWKKRIVGCFRRVFPRVQFIVSTHDPLCLRGIYEHETVLLRRDQNQQIVAVTNLPDPGDLQVDQLLASEFFGLNATLDTDLEDVYDEYYQLLLVRKLTKVQQARIAELKQLLQQRQHLGRGLRDELMYEVIDKLIAQERYSSQPKSRPELKAEALEQVMRSWEAAGLVTASDKGI